MNILEELVSHNLNYKAIVHKVGDTYEVIVYQWNEEETDDEGKPLWENIAGPFTIENFPAAKALAQSQLADLAGESPALNIDTTLETAAEEALGHADFVFLDPKNFQFSALATPESEDFEPLEAETLLLAGDFYYVKDSQNTWWSGFLYDEGQVRCWQKFKDLPQALNATK